MEAGSDPRVFFAAERTLLAWLRTGLAVIGFGFLIARFGLYLMIVRGEIVHGHPPVVSSLVGVTMVFLGTLMIAFAAWQHARFYTQIPPSGRPRRYSMSLCLWFAAVLSILGAALTVYLVSSMPAFEPIPVKPGFSDDVGLETPETRSSGTAGPQSMHQDIRRAKSA